MTRPATIDCDDCGTTVVVGKVGILPTVCKPCALTRRQKYRAGVLKSEAARRAHELAVDEEIGLPQGVDLAPPKVTAKTEPAPVDVTPRVETDAPQASGMRITVSWARPSDPVLDRIAELLNDGEVGRALGLIEGVRMGR